MQNEQIKEQPKEQLREQISSLVDGELSAQEFDALLSAMGSDETKEHWNTYHQIGDLLRSDDMSVAMSADFAARMDAALATEPVYINPRNKSSHLTHRKAAYVAVAAAMLLTVLVPKFAGHDGVEVTTPAYFVDQNAAINVRNQAGPSLASLSVSGNSNSAKNTNNHRQTQLEILRDPAIDSYLAAHQRYSKSMYSAVEYETGPINQEVEK